MEEERTIREEEEDWEGEVVELEETEMHAAVMEMEETLVQLMEEEEEVEQRIEMEMEIAVKKKWKNKRKRICHPERQEAIDAVEDIGGMKKRVVYLDPGINPIFTAVVANPKAFESRRLPSD